MQYILIFESLTSAKVKDCIVTDSILFIIQENYMGKAIGKGGSNIRKIESMLKKRVRLVEFSSDAVHFVQNLSFPAQISEIKKEEGIISIYCPDAKTKGRIIGRDRHNINSINSIVKRYFDIREVRVL